MNKSNINSNNKITEINKCRVCGNTKLIPIFDLGMQFLTGRFPSIDEENPLMAPLQLVKCDDYENKYACGLLQLKHNVALEEMYQESYGYKSGLNKTMTEHLNNVSRIVENMVELKTGDAVLDIGSNDATLLRSYKSSNIIKIGMDPAGEYFLEYYTNDIQLVPEYFNAKKFKFLYPNKKVKVITSIAMFYDLEEPMKFVKDIKDILHPEGIWVSEQSYLPSMLKMNSFDTICHEHLEYYSLKQIEWMAGKNNLKVFDIELNDINGGSFRVYICNENSSRELNVDKINKLRDYEKTLKLESKKSYNSFIERIINIKKEVSNFLISEKSKGKKIHLYGASTKGNVLLQFFNIGNDIIDAAADRNPDKWGKRTPGTNIPIISENQSRKSKPDYYLVLPWYFKKEFIQREQEFLRKGGKLIFPLPKLEII